MLESGQVSKVNTFHLDIKSLMNMKCGNDISPISPLGMGHCHCASVVLYWFSIGLKENCSRSPSWITTHFFWKFLFEYNQNLLVWFFLPLNYLVSCPPYKRIESTVITILFRLPNKVIREIGIMILERYVREWRGVMRACSHRAN